MDKIKAIYGCEPMRDGEYPTAIIVGSPIRERMVARIARREDNFGDHGLLWFDALDEAGQVIMSISGRAVAEIYHD